MIYYLPNQQRSTSSNLSLYASKLQYSIVPMLSLALQMSIRMYEYSFSSKPNNDQLNSLEERRGNLEIIPKQDEQKCVSVKGIETTSSFGSPMKNQEIKKDQNIKLSFREKKKGINAFNSHANYAKTISNNQFRKQILQITLKQVPQISMIDYAQIKQIKMDKSQIEARRENLLTREVHDWRPFVNFCKRNRQAKKIFQ